VISVGISGPAQPARLLAHAVSTQPDMVVASRPSDEVDVRVVLEGDGLEIHAPGKPGTHVPGVVGCVAARLAAALGAVSRLHLTALVPAGLRGPAAGPIDALVPLELPAPAVPGLETALTVQHVVVPATRCWLVGCAADLPEPIGRDELDELLAAAPRVVEAPERLGFADTAAVTELFRQLGRPQGSFWEAVVLGGSIRLDGPRLRCWVVAHDAAPFLEAVDAAREVAGAASSASTDAAAGVLTRLEARQEAYA
jgi:hypothetical protein